MAEAPKVEAKNGAAVPVQEMAKMSVESKPETKAANGTSPSPAPPAASPAPPKGDGSSSSLKDQFKAFSKFGDTKSDGKQITLSQSDKWMKQAKVS